jgi:signal transduction histidine kinase
MRERAELMGGTFTLRPSAGRGLTVSVRVPVVAERTATTV